MPINEQVDIVNENNVVVASTSKQKAHEDGLLHRTVIAQVIGSDGKWTLVMQSPDRQDAGQLVSPIGGHVRSGESAEAALQREAEEEYGLAGEFTYTHIGNHIFNREVRGRKENHYFLLYEIATDIKPHLNEEAVGYERFSKEELRDQLKISPTKFGDAFHFVVHSFYPELLN